jgi:hypothetical protein
MMLVMRWMAAACALVVTSGLARAQATAGGPDSAAPPERQTPPGLLPRVDELPAIPPVAGNPAGVSSSRSRRGSFQHGQPRARFTSSSGHGRRSRVARSHSRHHGFRAHRALVSRTARHRGVRSKKEHYARHSRLQHRRLTHRHRRRHHLALSPYYDAPAAFYGPPPPYMGPVYADPF